MKRLSLEDKKKFDGYFKRYPPLISEMTFTNLFTWQATRPILWDEINGYLVIKADVKNPYYFPPIGPDPKKLFSTLLEDAPIGHVPEALVKYLKGFKIIEDRPQWDYVYRQANLAGLPGEKYAEKRNFVNSASSFNPVIEECRPGIVKECLQLQEEWCNLRDCSRGSLYGENEAIKRTFKNSKVFPTKGMALRINGRIEAFTLGEPLNPETFIIHFEKANSSIRGVYQYINQKMAQTLRGYEWINREQDLGIEGLRKAKLSYHPAHFIKKYTLTL